MRNKSKFFDELNSRHVRDMIGDTVTDSRDLFSITNAENRVEDQECMCEKLLKVNFYVRLLNILKII